MKTPLLANEKKEAKKLKFSGFGEIDHFVQPFTKKGKINSRSQFITDLNLVAILNREISMKISTEIRGDLSDKTRNRFFLEEAYMDLRFEELDLRIGRQIVKWGRADGVNPTNNLNSIDYSDLLDTEREEIPLYGIRLRYYKPTYELDFVISPIFSTPVFPTENNSAWRPQLLATVPHPARPAPAMINVGYTFDGYQNPYTFAKNFSLGAKINFPYALVDFSASYFTGINDIPKYVQNPNLVNMDSLHVGINMEFYRWHVFGADFSSTINKVGIRGETALFISQKPEGTLKRDPVFLHWVLGLDRTIVDLVNGQNMFIVLLWSQELVINGEPFPKDDLGHIFRSSLILRLEQGLTNDLKSELQFLYDIYGKGIYLQPKILWGIADNLNLSGLVDILAGNKDAFWGQYRRNTRVQLKLQYNF